MKNETSKSSSFVSGRLVPNFVVDEEIEHVVKDLVRAWQGVVGYSLDGDPVNTARKQKEVNDLLARQGTSLRVYLKPYCDLYKLVGRDQTQQHHSCRVGVPNDEQDRWYAAGALCIHDEEK